MSAKVLFRLAPGLVALAGALTAPFALGDESATPEGISLEVIMADPDWLGRQPGAAWWSWDGESVFYRRKRENEKIQDLFRVPAAGGEPEMLAAADMSRAGAPGGEMNPAGDRLVFVHAGDVYIRDLENGALSQVTRSAADESDPFFMADGRSVAFRTGTTWHVHDPATGLTRQAADVRAESDPLAEEDKFDYLEAQQRRLFSTLRRETEREDTLEAREREIRGTDPNRLAPPIYLGDDVEITATSLSPNGRHMIVTTRAKNHEPGRNDQMPNYVTRSGYVESGEVRTLVGLDAPAPETVWVADLAAGEISKVDTAGLPGVDEDPLAGIREEAADWHVDQGAKREAVEQALKAPETRDVHVEGIDWSDDGRRVAVGLHSIDNKDRWIASLTPSEDAELSVQHRLTDEAWINWRHNEFGWLPGGGAIWYLSEETGYSHLYVKPLDDGARALTEGSYVVSTPRLNHAGDAFYFVANRQHPGWHDIYRVAVEGGEATRITDVGVEPAARTVGYDNPHKLPYRLSHDESKILFYDGSRTRPPELHAARLDRPGEPVRLTNTISEAFLSLPWTDPEIVQVPSSNTDRPIHGRLYLPPGQDDTGKRPAVVFVHGAGYLQNAHYGWSSYFREFMFHTLLNLHGYVVLDLDYRASAGYGRDWRTAIYRRMGHPELEDLLDGVDWLVENHGVDRERIGIYGGSYGGFMTFMAMFRAPETFAAGGSLRPVTDWTHYNHGYTSNILNTPLVDPMAYEKSSPIEFADSYASRPLAIFHGMQDDNVFFKDTVRLVQRLIELKKENYYPMFYPLDPHGFEHPESWLDEYRRIFALFEEHVNTGDPG